MAGHVMVAATTMDTLISTNLIFILWYNESITNI
jgi:hypothetical protein